MPCTSHANPLANTLCFPQILLSSQLGRFHVRLSPPIRGPWHPFGIGHCNPRFFGCNGHHAGQSKQKHNICYHDHTTRIGKALHPQTCNYWDWCLRYIQYCLKHEPYFFGESFAPTTLTHLWPPSQTKTTNWTSRSWATSDPKHWIWSALCGNGILGITIESFFIGGILRALVHLKWTNVQSIGNRLETCSNQISLQTIQYQFSKAESFLVWNKSW